MQKRSEKLKRLVAVQRHIETLAENELALTARHRAELVRALDEVIEALGSLDPVHRQFSRHYAERHGRLMVRERHLAGIQQMQETRLIKERVKADRLEERMRTAREMEDREAADAAIADLLDITFAKPPMK